MRLYHLVLTSALFALPVSAQDEIATSRATLNAALPDEVRELLAGVTAVQSLFPVNGSEPFAGTVLKADVISFSPDSELVLQNSTAPYIVIAARDVKFRDAISNHRIRFADTPTANGVDGLDGARGANGQGEENFTERPGAAGTTGGVGGIGTSRTLPHIYLIVDHFSIGNDTKPRAINLSLKLRGAPGGDGGRGGAGGDGGDGGEGHEGSDGFGFCKHGGGNGGNGGDGGIGASGSNGAIGGAGGSVTFVSTSRGVGQFSYASILNQGGPGGSGGFAGRSGRAGYGGPGGHGSKFCGGGHGGPAGRVPTAATSGIDGDHGAKGTVELISVPKT